VRKALSYHTAPERPLIWPKATYVLRKTAGSQWIVSKANTRRQGAVNL
jgi:hypothetical protein